jgi:hypothetical protein
MQLKYIHLRHRHVSGLGIGNITVGHAKPRAGFHRTAKSEVTMLYLVSGLGSVLAPMNGGDLGAFHP